MSEQGFRAREMAKGADFTIARRRLLRILGLGAALGTSPLAKAFAETRLAERKLKLPSRRQHVIVLDPGHGGVDPGAIGVSGVYEKDISLSVAHELARELENNPRYRVILTRHSDTFVELHKRVARARAAEADLFLSIHADALPSPEMRGASVFTLSERASDKEAAALAARENKVDLIVGIDLSHQAPEVTNILLDLTRRETNNLSISLARRLVSELGQEAVMLEHSHRSAGFAVLKAPDIPSALVELGCLSNREEERLLRGRPYQQKLTSSLVRSINGFFENVVRT